MLLNILSHDGFNLLKTASTNGGEYAGSCPWCGGKDRFRVWPEQGRYWCRGCGKHGDAIDWLRERRGMSFLEACNELKFVPSLSSFKAKEKTEITLRERRNPSEMWQAQAVSHLEVFQDALWEDQGKPAREFLFDRGLNEETIKSAGLGWNVLDRFRERESWGLPSEINDKGKLKKLWIPAGLVIPFIDMGNITRLRIRRTEGEPRYILIPGSDMRPMTWNLGRCAAVIVESELDGILLNQEAGDLAGVVAMGTATAKPDRVTHDALKKTEMILISLDSDEAGARASWKFWPETYGSKVKRWPCIKGKDPSEAMQNGLDLRSWIITGIFETFERYERFCIQTVDGGISDNEALAELKKMLA